MENPSSIHIESLINNITSFLSGNVCKNISIVKANNENLGINGELYFLHSFKVWKNVLKDKEKCYKNCATIFRYVLNNRNAELNNKTDEEIANQV